MPKDNSWEVLEYKKCKEDAEAHLDAIEGYQQAMGNYPTTEDGVPIMQNENGEWVPVYDAFFGNLEWSDAVAAEASYKAKAEGTVPIFGGSGPPISYSAEFQASASASMENATYMKGGVGVAMRKFTVKDLCEFCLNWPSFDFRFPSFDLMLNLILLLEIFLELLLVQLLIALLSAELIWLLQCPQFSCPEENPEQQQTPDYGAQDITDALENSVDDLATKEGALEADPLNDVFQNCGLSQEASNVSKEFLSSVSTKLTTAEVVTTLFGTPSAATVEVMKDTIKAEFPQLQPSLGSTLKINNFTKSVGKYVSNDEINKMNDTL